MRAWQALLGSMFSRRRDLADFFVGEGTWNNFCRRRFEATQCWQYDYDGIHPPPNSTVPSNSPLAIEHEDAYLSTNIVGSNAIEDVTEQAI